MYLSLLGTRNVSDGYGEIKNMGTIELSIGVGIWHYTITYAYVFPSR